MDRDQAHPVDPDLWVPYFETREFQYLGDPWPRYLVTMWERNRVGETRKVRTRIYGPDDEDAPDNPHPGSARWVARQPGYLPKAR